MEVFSAEGGGALPAAVVPRAEDAADVSGAATRIQALRRGSSARQLASERRL